MADLNLFDLSASLVLSIDDFQKNVDTALEEGKPLMELLEDLGNPTVSPGVDQNGNVFAVVMDSADEAKAKVTDAKTAVEEADDAINGLEERSEVTRSILEGLNQATGEIVEELIQGLVQYGKDAMELAAQTGSDVANQYNAVKETFDLSNTITQTKVGETLLTLKTYLLDVTDALIGVSQQEKAVYVLEKIDSYGFEKLQEAKENFSILYGMFEKVKMPEEQLSLGDLAQGQISQLEFWKEYNNTVSELETRLSGHGDAKKLLAELNTGTTESLSQMNALLSASDQEIAAFLDYFTQVEAERDAAAEKSAEMQLLFDENVQKMAATFDSLVSGLDQSGAAEANAYATSAAAVNGLAANYDSFSAMVDKYNSKAATLGSATVNQNAVFENPVLPDSPYDILKKADGSHATGLDYVPYDNYRALLHEGESVLTKAEATEWRRGESAGQAFDIGELSKAVSAAVAGALNGVAVNMDGQAVGNVVTKTVSRNIEQLAFGGRFA